MMAFFTIKSTEGSDYYMEQTLSQLEATKRSLAIKNPPLATLASGSLLRKFLPYTKTRPHFLNDFSFTESKQEVENKR